MLTGSSAVNMRLIACLLFSQSVLWELLAPRRYRLTLGLVVDINSSLERLQRLVAIPSARANKKLHIFDFFLWQVQ